MKTVYLAKNYACVERLLTEQLGVIDRNKRQSAIIKKYVSFL